MIWPFRRLRRALGMGWAATAGGVLIYDTFTGANGTLLTAHAPDVNTPGGAWTALVGTWDIQSNRAQTTFSGNAARIETGISDFVVRALIATSTAAGVPTLCGRVTDASNMWLIQASNAANALRILERTAGANVLRASAAVTIVPNFQYDVVATFNSTSISATLDGTTSVSYTSSVHELITGVGLRSSSGTCYFDNLEVTAL